jgi:hypothetical protein
MVGRLSVESSGGVALMSHRPGSDTSPVSKGGSIQHHLECRGKAEWLNGCLRVLPTKREVLRTFQISQEWCSLPTSIFFSCITSVVPDGCSISRG